MFMSLGRWFQRQCRQTRIVRTMARRPRTRLQVEWLEDRVVPATFDVTTLADGVGPGTLRNAIQQANTNGQADNTINLTLAGTYALTLTPTNNQVTGVLITAGGTGYTTAPTVTFTGGGGTGAAGTAIISGGSVIGVQMTNAGTGLHVRADRHLHGRRRERGGRDRRLGRGR